MQAHRYRPHLALAHALADRAREIVLPFFHSPQTRMRVERKADGSPVTAADRRAEQAMRAMIADAFPTHGVIGEEFGGDVGGGDGDVGGGDGGVGGGDGGVGGGDGGVGDGDGGAVDGHGAGADGDGGADGVDSAEQKLTWCIDPIDGTRAFLSGRPTFGTLIALLRGGVPVLGVIDMPRLDERWVGVVGAPTVMNGEPCTALAAAALGDATLLCTDTAMFDAEQRPRFDALCARVAGVGFGTDCYGYALLASGFADIVMEADLACHDFAALVPVVQGAGGCISDWDGAPLTVNAAQKKRAVLACADKKLHALALAAIAR